MAKKKSKRYEDTGTALWTKIWIRPKAKLSYETKERVRAAGGEEKHKADVGYLPRGYMSNPKKFSLNSLQKKRVRKMFSSLSRPGFKERFGFNK